MVETYYYFVFTYNVAFTGNHELAIELVIVSVRLLFVSLMI